jgi:biotin carboxyl carrier protein
MKYFVTVAGRELEVEIDGDDVVVEGQSVRAHLDPVPGTPLRQLTIDGRIVHWPFERIGAGRWRVAPHGEAVEAEVMDERTRHIRQLTGDGRAQAGPARLTAPMPGLVVRVEVEPGQRVAPGDSLVVLEAMKMENELRASAGSVVAAVLVQAGAAVEKGDVLVEFGDAGDA